MIYTKIYISNDVSATRPGEYNYPIKIRSSILEQDHKYFYDLTKK